VVGVVIRHPVIASVVSVLAVLVALWAVELVQVKTGVERAREYWAQPQGEEGGLLYVAMGDSVTQGVGASRPDLG